MFADRTYNLLPLTFRDTIRDFFMFAYRPRMTSFFKEFISKGDLVFDIGANRGELTEVFLRLGAKVISVDPQPSSIKILREKYKNNKNVTVVENGVGQVPGHQIFYISTNNHTTSTFSNRFKDSSRYHGRKWDKKKKIKVVTIEQLLRRYGVPVFCKIDTEGYELPILKALKTKIKYLSFEFSQEFLGETTACISHLSSIGKVKFNYSPFFSYYFTHNEWITGEALINKLNKKNGKYLCGDIYAEFA